MASQQNGEGVRVALEDIAFQDFSITDFCAFAHQCHAEVLEDTAWGPGRHDAPFCSGFHSSPVLLPSGRLLLASFFGANVERKKEPAGHAPAVVRSRAFSDVKSASRVSLGRGSRAGQLIPSLRV